MNVDELIGALGAVKEKVGGDKDIVFVGIGFGENDYLEPSYPIVGDFCDQDGGEFNCAIVCGGGGSEFTERGTPHYKWAPNGNRVESKCGQPKAVPSAVDLRKVFTVVAHRRSFDKSNHAFTRLQYDGDFDSIDEAAVRMLELEREYENSIYRLSIIERYIRRERP